VGRQTTFAQLNFHERCMMSSVFYHSDSYVLPFCDLVAVPDGAADVEADPCQELVDASQAVAIFRRIDEFGQDVEFDEHDDLEALSIDDLRVLASELHVPERSKITEKSELIAEIRRRL
jgi:hypothetical protein